jgi:hypothetical protein
MQTKLTLRMDDGLIRQAKAFATANGKSVSQIVAEYFSVVASDPEEEITPAVRSLKGILRGHSVGIDEYRGHLEEKHL